MTSLIDLFHFHFGVPVSGRKFLLQHHPPEVALSGICVDSGRPADLVYVCSICLSIFCKDQAICARCGSRFKRDKREERRLTVALEN